MTPVISGLWHKLIAFQVYGANTGVGKTVACTVLGKAFRTHHPDWHINYLKPVSTGPATDADDKYVKRYTGHSAKCIFQFSDPVSPHIAARSEPPSDQQVLGLVSEELFKYARSVKPKGKYGVTLVETAGGVLSPAPSGSLQADLYRPLRLPVILVGDHRLGGIAATISAFESLTVRGYDVEAVMIFESGKLGNTDYLMKYFKNQKLPVFELPALPPAGEVSTIQENMVSYYNNASKQRDISRLTHHLVNRHFVRLKDVERMASEANSVIWHPFTQHKDRTDSSIVTLDSAYGDFFQTYSLQPPVEHVPIPEEPTPVRRCTTLDTPLLRPAFDGSASWWTQGLGHGNPKLSLAAAYAAGRYGHVMFAGAIHQPALSLANKILQGLENPRLRKVFFSDNGSTGIEVAIKMALKASSIRYGWESNSKDIGILGLKGSYHGDTIGAMDCSEPSTYNEKVEWYHGRGHWFDFPQVKMRKGAWVIEPPAGMENEFGPAQSFKTLDDVFDFEIRDSAKYERHIEGVLNWLIKFKGRKFGALVIEPVLLGAGGMIFVDPLYQRTLVNVVRRSNLFHTPSTRPFISSDEMGDASSTWTGLPVVFDEVFTGLYRLGRFSSASFLKVHPDISIHAKLLTGGLLPLCTTLASQSIFDAFLSDEKTDALLHGHSYTAHAVGCHVANVSLNTMGELVKGQTWKTYQNSWCRPTSSSTLTWSMWSKETVTALSHNEQVDGVVALGSVLAISLHDESGSGYTSNAANHLRDALLHESRNTRWIVHSRVLGNVLYLMASMTTDPETISALEKTLLAKLQDLSNSQKA